MGAQPVIEPAGHRQCQHRTDRQSEQGQSELCLVESGSPDDFGQAGKQRYVHQRVGKKQQRWRQKGGHGKTRSKA